MGRLHSSTGRRTALPVLLAVLALGALTSVSLGADTAPAVSVPSTVDAKLTINSGDTAWMLISSALVMLMVPGLALFYGGMVRKKNVLATVAQSFGATCVITVLWMVIGYSIAFTTNPNAGMNSYIGSFSYFLLAPMGLDAVNPLAPTIPESVYMFFQMTFAIITPALIAGALADRMKFSAFLWFMAVLRDRIGQREDRFFATVFMGSGLLFVGLFIAGAAATGGLAAGFRFGTDASLDAAVVGCSRPGSLP